MEDGGCSSCFHNETLGAESLFWTCLLTPRGVAGLGWLCGVLHQQSVTRLLIQCVCECVCCRCVVAWSGVALCSTLPVHVHML